MVQVHIKLVESLTDSHKDRITTAQSLSLHKIGDCTTQPDNSQTKGKAAKIIHPIEVSKA